MRLRIAALVSLLLVPVSASADSLHFNLYRAGVASLNPIAVGTLDLTVADGFATYFMAIDPLAPVTDSTGPLSIVSLAFNSDLVIDPSQIAVQNAEYIARAGGTDHFAYDVYGPGFGTTATVTISGLSLNATTQNFLATNPLVKEVFGVDSAFGVGAYNDGHGFWAYAQPKPVAQPVDDTSLRLFSEPAPVGVPEPATAALLLAGLLITRRRH